MTKERMSPMRWLGVGSAALVLGLVTLAVAVPLAALDEDGWPWHASISEQADQGRAEIAREDGTIEAFTGTPAAARSWLDDRQAVLKEQYGIPTKVAVGKALTMTSYALLLLGGGILVWRLGATLAARRRLVSRA